MNPQEVKYIQKNGRIRIGILDLILSYLSLIFIVVIPWVIWFAPTIYSIFQNRMPSYKSIIIAIVFTTVLFLVIISINKKLRLEKIFKYDDTIDIEQEILSCFKKLGWSYSKLSEYEYVASTPISWYSWGETIHLIFYDNQIFMNSMGKTSPITFGKDSKNLKDFQKLIVSREIK